MSNYGWTNADGEPIMDGAAYRFEQALDAQYADERGYDDDYYASELDLDNCNHSDRSYADGGDVICDRCDDVVALWEGHDADGWPIIVHWW